VRKQGLLRDVDIHRQDSWENRIFLTFDVDWAHDKVVIDSAQLIESYGVKATWFYTHASELIDQLIKRGHDVGIHPNFNKTLLGESHDRVDEIVNECMSWCPNACTSRSHSLVYGAPIAKSLVSNQISSSSNMNIPASSGIEIKPWISSSGLIELPYSWADEHIWASKRQLPISAWAQCNGLLVADFHPIHVFLNSQTSEVYEKTRTWHQNPDELLPYRSSDQGTRTELEELCRIISS
jgi:hypothetical protein